MKKALNDRITNAVNKAVVGIAIHYLKSSVCELKAAKILLSDFPKIAEQVESLKDGVEIMLENLKQLEAEGATK